MSYQEKFKESQKQAHQQNVATKILGGLEDLRSKIGNSPSAARRWVWELIQNAKDVHPEGGVKIIIHFSPESNPPSVTFTHNGGPFSVNDIRFLIEQISTKDRSIADSGRRRSTGKFGTGFLSTHLLSEMVKVSGVVKEPEHEPRKFEIVLDRSGKTTEAITAAVQKSEEALERLDGSPLMLDYKDGEFNTSFRYDLSDAGSIEAAKTGLRDLLSCLPYSLLFVSEIESIGTPPQPRIFRRDSVRSLNPGISTAKLSITEPNLTTMVSIVHLAKGHTTIAIPAEEGDASSFTLLQIPKHAPRIFCDFPLVGTESFPFPVIINNPNFNPTDPRDGIYLTSPTREQLPIEENKEYICQAVELYTILVDYATRCNWGNLHLLAYVPTGHDLSERIDPKWFLQHVTDPIKKLLLRAKIVRTVSGHTASMQDEKGKNAIYFPYGRNKETREKIWRCASEWFPSGLPRLEDVEFWYEMSWLDYGKLTISQMADFIVTTKSVAGLSKVLAPGVDPLDWLNFFYALLADNEKVRDRVITDSPVIPNQNGDLCKLSALYRDTGDISDDFKSILKSLDRDVRAELIAKRVQLDYDVPRVRDRAYAVELITAEVEKKTAERETAKKYGKAFKLLLLYFQSEPQEAQELFPNLYKRKHRLYDDDEMLQNVSKAERLDQILTEFGVKNVEDLRDLIARGADPQKSLLPKTEQLVLAMGITSLEDWQRALEDNPDLAERFSHESTPTLDMFLYVQGLIKKAKARVINHLQTLSQYDLHEMDETAPTIIAGVKKENKRIQIAVRPAYGGEVIIYYTSELDVLDFENGELWVVDGKDEVRRISLGHILKKGQITKFPI